MGRRGGKGREGGEGRGEKAGREEKGGGGEGEEEREGTGGGGVHLQKLTCMLGRSRCRGCCLLRCLLVEFGRLRL